MVWSEGNMSLKNPVTPPGIDPGTVRLEAQRFNHYATPGPLTDKSVVQVKSRKVTGEFDLLCDTLQTLTQNKDSD